MKIIVNTPTINAVGQKVTFRFDDQSGAHVSFVLGVGDLAPIFHDQEWGKGVWDTTIDVPTGKTYKCALQISAYHYKALNRSYLSSLSFVDGQGNATLIASTKGSIPASSSMDDDFVQFDLKV